MARKKLRNKRISKGLTQNDVANAAGICRSFYVNIENGKKNCSIHVWLKILKALDIPESDLVQYITSKEKKGA